MVEGVMVFPITIMAVTVLIFMMTYFYSQLDDRVDMHIILRAESGELCDNLFYVNRENTEIPVFKKTQQLYSKSNVSIDNSLILSGRHKEISARKYLIDECRFIRMTGAIGSGSDSNDE